MDQSNAQTEIIQLMYQALNLGDTDAILELFDSSVERMEFPHSDTPKFFQGLDEIRDHFEQGRSTWDQGGCHPEHMTWIGPWLIVDVYVKVRLKNHQDWIEGRVADVFAFQKGRISRMHSFQSLDEARLWIEKGLK